MARKKKNADNPDIDENLDDDEEKSKGGFLFSLITAIVIIVIWLVIFGLLIKMDVGGFGSTVLRPILKDIPIVNLILPDASDEEVAAETGYKYKNLAQAVERIKELEREIENNQNSSNADKEKIAELEAEVARLKVFEDNQTYFEELKKKFDEEVVFADEAPDINAYKEWYESISPENANDLYEQVLIRLNYSKRVEEWADAFSRMEADSAAAILSEMTGDIDLVADILYNVKVAQRAAILSEMDPVFAAKITKLMHPSD